MAQGARHNLRYADGASVFIVATSLCWARAAGVWKLGVGSSESGGRRGDRTPGLCIANAALSQLS